ncbi:MAG: 16S rRNA (adenine(1518)-N(6)/adenine(1519)-N(6))-dimethyltransferase RsmA [Planctomycetota bacterium]
MRGFRFDPRKGQNFLFDGNLLRALVRDSEISPDLPILEIGPGAGTLTRALLAAGSQVTAVEIDPLLAGYLRETFPEDSLRVVEADALETKNRLSEELLAALPEGEFQMVANLPYSIASPLVCLLVEACPRMTGFSVLVQQEVADRWIAVPGSREYGTSSVLLSRLGQGRITRKVPPHAFVPAPRVDSAFIRWQRAHPAPDQPRDWPCADLLSGATEVDVPIVGAAGLFWLGGQRNRRQDPSRSGHS